MAIDMQIPPAPPNTPVTTNSGASTPCLVDSMVSDLQIASPTRNTVIIGVSGPPSSGKKVLTSLLAEIFRTVTPKDELASEFSLDSSGEVKQNKVPVQRRVTIVHQKDYLFADPGFMALRDFCSTKKDYDYMHKALHSDGLFLFETNGTLPLTAGFEEGSTDTSVYPHLIDRTFSSSATSRVVMQGGSQVNLRATASDRDSDPSIRFTALQSDLEIIQAGSNPLHLRVAGSGKLRNSYLETDVQATKSALIIVEHASLVEEMQNKVQSAFRTNETNTDFCFVEGSFLYKNPANAVNDSSRFTADQREARAQQHMDVLNDLTSEIEEDGGVGSDEQWAKRAKVEKAMDKCNDVAKGMMQTVMQIKLLLPTSKEVAKDRHFAKKPYIDGPAGKRVDGEMCTTDGYFESIIWENWTKEHDWLPTDADYYPSIYVRPVINAGIDFTVRWAVDTILQDMGYEVADPQAKQCCGEGCCERGRSGSSTDW